MKCPHCLQGFFSTQREVELAVQDIGPTTPRSSPAEFSLFYEECPNCERAIIRLQRREGGHGTWFLVYPRGMARSPLPAEVPNEFATDYQEACLVLADSPKASAALSRRCLQHVLREKQKTTKKDLYYQIEETIPKVPTHLGEMLHDVRVIGNFAAHPQKSTNTGEIIDVEPQEADWLLETLEAVLDFYFVQPARAKQKRDAINAKLQESRKPPSE